MVILVLLLNCYLVGENSLPQNPAEIKQNSILCNPSGKKKPKSKEIDDKKKMMVKSKCMWEYTIEYW